MTTTFERVAAWRTRVFPQIAPAPRPNLDDLLRPDDPLADPERTLAVLEQLRRS